MVENTGKVRESQEDPSGLSTNRQSGDSNFGTAGRKPGDSDPDPYESRAWCNVKKWLVFREATGEIKVMDFNCGSWGCRKCIGKLKWKWANIIAWGVARIDRLRFLTLTKFPKCEKEASMAYGNLNRDLRAAGYAFEYFGFNEISKGGMRHKHILLRGDYIPQDIISRRAAANGLGSIVWIEQVDDSQKAYEYISKYIGKNPDSWTGRKFSYSKKFFFGKTTKQIWLEFLESKFGERDPDWNLALIDWPDCVVDDKGYPVVSYKALCIKPLDKDALCRIKEALKFNREHRMPEILRDLDRLKILIEGDK